MGQPVHAVEQGHKGVSVLVVVLGVVLGVAMGLALFAIAALGAVGGLPGVAKPDYSKNGFSASDLGSLAVAGATLLLATFTALLAWFTRSSIAETRRAAQRADQAVQAAQDQAEATNTLSETSQEQLSASWWPIFADPLHSDDLAAAMAFDPNARTLGVVFRNVGPGPARIEEARVMLGDDATKASNMQPSIVPHDGNLYLTFLFGQDSTDRVEIATYDALLANRDLAVEVFYRGVAGRRIWRSRGRLVAQSGASHGYNVREVEVDEASSTSRA